MDGTYNLTAERYPLYVLATQDNSGYTRPVATAFVGADTKANIAKVLQLFKKCFDAATVAKTRIVFVDKDQREIGALKDEFPGAQVLLCWFHVLKAMKTAVADLDCVKEEKERIFAASRRTVYSYDEEQYQRNVHQLAQNCSAEFFAYFTKNWDNCKVMWAFYARKELPTLANQTTNRVEALNRAIKAVFRAVQRTSMTFAKAVQTLLKFLVLTDVSVTYTDFVNIEKTPYVIHQQFGGVLKTAGSRLTGQALRLITVQLSKLANEVDYLKTEDLGDGAIVVKNAISNVSYSLQIEPATNDVKGITTSMLTCSCFFSCTFGLPCRHVFLIRKTLENNEFFFSDCVPRWNRD